MLIKYITCKVKEGCRKAFDEEQKRWRALSPVNGFLGQIGGWSVKDPFTAVLMGFWSNEEDYHYFMDHIHDEILLHSDQSNTYTSIDVYIYNECFHISAADQTLIQVIEQGEYVRIDSFEAEHGRMDRCIQKYEQTLQQIEGMLSATFACSEKRVGECLFFSCWKEERPPQDDYVPIATLLPCDAEGFDGEGCKVEENWRVLPEWNR
ncbi:YdbC family protein [Rossellomorea aquimaris]|uniref:YdbC family protein n=1 Tax=Rossellomorea aquimaris TaxID=189382 RepID=UPI001CD7FEEF|nr:YdbC family protein [Rossellomorea aquimaris]MCA1055864.1 YdbC family protein [Rossellomorea aquimaris]